MCKIFHEWWKKLSKFVFNLAEQSRSHSSLQFDELFFDRKAQTFVSTKLPKIVGSDGRIVGPGGRMVFTRKNAN